VDVDGHGLLILGPSGSGKSSLALTLIGLGARLVADDQVDLARRDDGLAATCPAPLRGMIEARGIGLLRAPTVTESRVRLAVDLGRTETARLPERNAIVFLGAAVDLVCGPMRAHFPAALLLYLKSGREA
jgi:HPr kinase/phosphorylase